MMSFRRVHDEFRRWVAAHPGALALEAADALVTYHELDARAGRLAARLARAGAVPGDLVGVLAGETVDVAAALLAVWRSGLVFVPFDPAAPPRRHAEQAAQVPPRWFLHDRPLAERAERLAAVSGARTIDLARAPGPEVEEPEWPAVDPDAPCYVYFTSGSTGGPKGITGRVESVAHFISWEIETFGLGPGSRVSQLTAVGFDAFLRDLFAPLCAGGTVCIPPGREAVLDARRLVAWIDRSRIELVHCVPTLFRNLLGQPLDADRFPALRWVLLSGEPLLPADVRQWHRTFGDRIRLVNLYGPSETTMTKLYHLVRPEDAEARAIPIGKPMPGCRAVVVDGRDQACPPGRIGEILIRTPYRSLGYYGQPEKTREAFVPNPFGQDPEDLVYRTGDFGRMREDGTFEFLGRRDAQVKVRGLRVELPEVEDAVRRFDGVVDVAVVDRRDEEGQTYLAGYLVAADGVDLDDLRRHLADRLPEGMIPTVFVVLDELPRTLSGKVDRGALPEPRSARLRGDPEPLRTPVEEILAGIWSKALGVEPIGSADHFFALGGQSLLAMRVLGRVGEAFGVELPLMAVFDAPVLAAQARRIEEAMRAQASGVRPPLVAAPDRRTYPLAHHQRSVWMAHQLDAGSDAYHLPMTATLRGRLDLPVLSRSLDEIVRRHEVLRTVFVAGGDDVEQVVEAPRHVPVPLIDLSRVASGRRSGEAARVLSLRSSQPFDLERGPVLRALVVRLEEESHGVALILHHLVGDAPSLRILLREVATLYGAFRAHEASPLADLPIQFGDYAAWQRGWLDEPEIERQVEYWQTRLAGSVPVVLPPDRPAAPGGPRRSLESVSSLFPVELTERVRTLGQRHGATLFLGLVAALSVVLHKLSGREDLVIGTDLSSRDRAEMENLVGYFINQVVLRVDLSGEPRFTDLLRRVREEALAAYVHGDVPFDRVVEALRAGDRPGQRDPFQVKLTFPTDGSGTEEALSIPDLEIEPVAVRRQTAKLDLLLEARPTPQGLVVKLDFDRDLFDRGTVAPILDHLQSVLERVTEQPEARLWTLARSLDGEAPAGDAAGRSPRRRSSLEKLRKTSRGTPHPAQAEEPS